MLWWPSKDHMQTQKSFPPPSFMGKLSPGEQAGLHSIAREHRYAKGNYIFQANQPNDTVYILLNGRVKIIRLATGGKELIQWFCMPGEIFGLSEDDETPYRGLYAQTLSKSDLLRIPKQDFDQLLLDHPRLALVIVKQLASRLRTLGNILLYLTSDDAQSRFVKLIRRLSACYGRHEGKAVYIDVHLTHQEMADMIGVCRQTVSSMLGEYKRAGILTSDRKGIHIQKPDSLDQQYL